MMNLLPFGLLEEIMNNSMIDREKTSVHLPKKTLASLFTLKKRLWQVPIEPPRFTNDDDNNRRSKQVTFQKER